MLHQHPVRLRLRGPTGGPSRRRGPTRTNSETPQSITALFDDSLDIDTLRRRLMVVENAVYANGSILVGTPKTHERRSVPYPKFLTAPIAEACEGRGRDDIVFDDGRGGYQRAPAVVTTGANVRAVRRMLGHASVATTLDSKTILKHGERQPADGCRSPCLPDE